MIDGRTCWEDQRDEAHAQLAAAIKERDEALDALADRCIAVVVTEKERDAALSDVASLRLLVDRSFATGGEVLAERDRLRAVLEPTPENITEIASSIDRNQPEWWKYEVAAVLAAIRAKAGLP